MYYLIHFPGAPKWRPTATICTPNSFIHLSYNSPDMDVVDVYNILIIPSDSVLWEKTTEASYLVGSFPCQFD